MTLFIGTSGWQYGSWREVVYPRSVKQPDWLDYFAERFQTVEVNNSFYRLPEPSTFRRWQERSPDDFVFVLKLSRYLSHIKRLREPQEPIERFFRHAEPLRSKMGPVLLQLPPNLEAEPARLEETLALMPSGVRVAVEFRHSSWYTPEVRSVLERHNAALCLADRHSRILTPEWRTADWGYVRLHEGAATPHPCYGRTSLEGWARRIARVWDPDAEVYAFFNNDHLGCAVRDARLFALAAQRVGLRPTRVPSADDIHFGAEPPPRKKRVRAEPSAAAEAQPAAAAAGATEG